MIRIHKEGKMIIPVASLLLAIPAVMLWAWLPSGWILWGVSGFLFVVWILVVRFFRVPVRPSLQNTAQVFSSADGKVVVIEEVTEDEYFHDKRLQVSVFMSIYNVHINWAPVTGTVVYQKYHPGRFFPAWLPKSSQLNERNTFVIKNEAGQQILVRQIAGAVARRIASYKLTGERVCPGDQLGFIRFGSRVDVFLPIGSEIKVVPGQKVTGSETLLAVLPKLSS